MQHKQLDSNSTLQTQTICETELQAPVDHRQSNNAGCTTCLHRNNTYTTASAVGTCSWQMPAMVPPSSMRNTPAATAPPASPARSPAAARCVATRDEEQAVCVARHGPVDVSSGHHQIEVVDCSRI